MSQTGEPKTEQQEQEEKILRPDFRHEGELRRKLLQDLIDWEKEHPEAVSAYEEEQEALREEELERQSKLLYKLGEKIRYRAGSIREFVEDIQDEHIGAFAGQSTFFIFLSFFPLISVILTIVRILPFTEEELVNMVYQVFPEQFRIYVADMINDIYRNTSGSVALISVVLAVWSAAKGIMSIRSGLNEVYRSREKKNYFMIRGISSIYTILVILLIIVMIPLNVFGRQIFHYINKNFMDFSNFTYFIFGLRTVASFVALFLVFWIMYTLIPNRKLRFRRQMPGAFFTAGIWMLMTKLLSVYFSRFMTKSYMYGSLTTVVLILFWMYWLIYFLFVGAEINEYLYRERKKSGKYLDDVKIRKRRRKEAAQQP